MKKLICAALILGSFSTSAQVEQPKHIISIGTEGFGWTGASKIFDWDKNKSGVKDDEQTNGDLILNYNYVLPNRIMIGAFLKNETLNSDSKATDGSKTEKRKEATELGLGVGYNFNEDVFNSWWGQALVSTGSHSEVTKDSSGKADYDFNFSSFYLKFGKRINLDSWGLKNISYNPTISFSTTRYSGDAKDKGLKRANQVSLEIIKFDILF